MPDGDGRLDPNDDILLAQIIYSHSMQSHSARPQLVADRPHNYQFASLVLCGRRLIICYIIIKIFIVKKPMNKKIVFFA